MTRREWAGFVAASITLPVLIGCGVLRGRDDRDQGTVAAPVPSQPCEMVGAQTRDLLVPDGTSAASGGEDPEPGATATAGCTVTGSGDTGGSYLEFLVIRFPEGGAERYSGFPTAEETYQACSDRLHGTYPTGEPRERFEVGLGQRSEGAFDSNHTSNGQLVIDKVEVCVLDGLTEVEVDYWGELPQQQLRDAAIAVMAEVLGNQP